MLSQAHQNPQIKSEAEGQDKGINIDPKTYCKLGHFNLLLEEYAKGQKDIYIAELKIGFHFFNNNFFSSFRVPKIPVSSQ